MRHVVHVGWPKTGSSFLRRWFLEHPQVRFAPGRIAGYETVYDLARAAADPPGPEVVWATSSESLVVPTRFVGDGGIDYEQLRGVPLTVAREAACATLAALFPSATILLVTRGYESMLRSDFSQWTRTAGPGDLAEFCSYFERGARVGENELDYDRVIAGYRSAFGADAVLVMPYELLEADPASFTSHLASRLGIDAGPMLAERQNPALEAPSIDRYNRLTRVVRSIPVSGQLRHRLARWYGRRLHAGSFDRALSVLDRRRSSPSGDLALPTSLLDAVSGTAESLRGDPLYAAFGAAYRWTAS